MRAAGLIAIMAFGLLQSGCASLGRDDCLIGDWAAIGYRDGADGRPPSRLYDHAQACATYGVAPGREAYFAARERGLDVYCTPHRGFEAGRLGRKYHGVCPPRLARGFLGGYDAGLRVHAATEHHEDLRSDVRELDSRVDDIEDELGDIRDRLAGDELTGEARETVEQAERHLLADLHHAREQRDLARYRERAAGEHASRLYHVLSRHYRRW